MGYEKDQRHTWTEGLPGHPVHPWHPWLRLYIKSAWHWKSCIIKNGHFCHLAEAFCGDPPPKAKESVIKAGECALVCLQGRSQHSTLQRILRESEEEFKSCRGKNVATYISNNPVLQLACLLSNQWLEGGHFRSSTYSVGLGEEDGWLLPKMTDLPPVPSKLIAKPDAARLDAHVGNMDLTVYPMQPLQGC